MKETIDSYCGLKCYECNYREECNCGTCHATEGHPFYGKCEIAECIRERGIKFCGECWEFPCELIKRYSFDKEHGENGARIDRCKELKSALVKEAREGIDAISVCGHHCDYCFMGQWCGGCRSNYNCCSFAMINEEKKCENVKCAYENKYDGCYECPELEQCKKGYYGNDKEYVAKATALFIKKYGKNTYTATLKKAIDAGMNYPKSFDAEGSVENAVKLLEKYL